MKGFKQFLQSSRRSPELSRKAFEFRSNSPLTSPTRRLLLLLPPINSNACKARGSDLRVHFKNTRETAHAIRKMQLGKAKSYLEDVLAHKQAIPFRPLLPWCWSYCSGEEPPVEWSRTLAGERAGCGFTLCLSHPGQPGSETETPHISCSWKNKS
ncbi:hypothetical protein GBA52_011740 [Prunus armeniaca]|nr:hypothetical protein GBA52_011740 [Prunus armeniaca]